MTDILMCIGDDCPIRDRCIRYAASYYLLNQSYMKAPYHNGECGYFWDKEHKKPLGIYDGMKRC